MTTEFINAKYTDVFTNASLGWPAIVSVNLPSGGPSPPLAALGMRLRANVNDNLTIAAAIFDGDAAGPGPADPQLRDNAGVVHLERKKGWSGARRKIQDRRLAPFRWVLWSALHGTGRFTREPLGSGVPACLGQHSGVYSVFEQKIYRLGRDDDSGIGIFARVASSPRDWNLIDLYADGGIEFIGLSDARPKDKFGIAGGYAHALDIDFQQIMGPAWPLLSFEAVATAVYQYEVRPGWTLQPNFQFFFRPGGGATDPLGANPGKLLKGCGGLRPAHRAQVLMVRGRQTATHYAWRKLTSTAASRTTSDWAKMSRLGHSLKGASSGQSSRRRWR
jgi:porin